MPPTLTLPHASRGGGIKVPSPHSRFLLCGGGQGGGLKKLLPKLSQFLLRQQIRHTVWMEAAAIGVIGLALGLILGAAELYYAIEISRRDLVGIDIGYSYPFATALALAPVILGAAFLAALGPAESAVRGSLVEALEYE